MPSVLLTPVPHDEASSWIKGKPVVAREVFDGLLPDLKARAMVITGVENANVVQSVRDRIAELPQGADWDTVKADIVDKISPWIGGEGEEGAAAAERRAELLMRTHGFQAYSGAMDQVMDRQQAAFPYAQYVSAQDDKVRDSHAALDGLVLPADSTFWDTHTGPWEWGCRCTKVPLTESDVADMREADAKKPLEERRVLDSGRLAALEKSNKVAVAKDGGVPQFVSTQPSGTFTFSPKTLRMDAAELKTRYEPETWKTFETWARGQKLDTGKSVLEWLTKKPETSAPATPSAIAATTTSSKSAASTKEEVPAPKSTAVPAGTPVSQALTIRTTGAHKPQIQTALAAIDKVHGDGDLPAIPIYGRAGATAAGEYVHRAGEPVQIGVRNLAEQWPSMTTAHEIGHFLDHQVLGKAGEFASASHPALADFRAAVLASDTVQTIAKLPASDRGKLLTDRELWARAYAQYIALRSRDPLLSAQLDKIRASREPWRQWSEKDFAPIASAIDSLFKEKGWIK